MSYPYCCPWCGKRHTANELLIDFGRIITQNSSFRSFVFYMTVGEITEIGEKNAENVALQKRIAWKPDFSELMHIISNSRNMDMPALEGLSLEHIQEFVNYDKQSYSGSCQSFADSLLFNDNFDDNDSADKIILPELDPSNPILDLLVDIYKDGCFNDFNFEYYILLDDLKALYKIYEHGNPSFIFMPERLSGFVVSYSILFNYSFTPTARLCPKCKRKVPNSACSVPQKLVTFFGNMLANKTSTLITLTHFAMYGQSIYSHDSYWSDEDRISQINYFKIESVSPFLMKEVERDDKRAIPPKYGIRTFDMPVVEILVNAQNCSSTLLTMINPPGELCTAGDNFSEIDKRLLYTQFPAVINSDLMIHCVSPVNFMRKEIKACISSTESLLGLLDEVGNYCPVLTLFTDLSLKTQSKRIQIANELNMLYDEYLSLKTNDISNNYMDESKSYDRISIESKVRFRNVMHCCPFSPYRDQKFRNENDDNISHFRPYSENIPLLMLWILRTIGALDISLDSSNTKQVKILRNQFRHQPSVNRDEAIARCILFSNPGENDRRIADTHNKLMEFLTKILAHLDPKG